MTNVRLNGLALMYVHRNSISIDSNEILHLWDTTGHRRIALGFDKK